MYRGLVGLAACGAVVGAAVVAGYVIDKYNEYKTSNKSNNSKSGENDKDGNYATVTVHIDKDTKFEEVKTPEESKATEEPKVAEAETPKTEPRAAEPEAESEVKTVNTQAHHINPDVIVDEVGKLANKAYEMLKTAATNVQDPDKIAEVAEKATEKFNEVASDINILARSIADTVLTDDTKKKLNDMKEKGYEATDKLLNSILNKDNGADKPEDSGDTETRDNQDSGDENANK